MSVYPGKFREDSPDDYEKALQWAEKTVKEFPDDPNVLDTQATLYEDLGQYDEALILFKRCLHLYADGEMTK